MAARMDWDSFISIEGHDALPPALPPLPIQEMSL